MLPVYKVAAARMAPDVYTVHPVRLIRAPFVRSGFVGHAAPVAVAVGIGTVHDVVIAVVVDAPVGVVHPLTGRVKVIFRTFRVTRGDMSSGVFHLPVCLFRCLAKMGRDCFHFKVTNLFQSASHYKSHFLNV